MSDLVPFGLSSAVQSALAAWHAAWHEHNRARARRERTCDPFAQEALATAKRLVEAAERGLSLALLDVHEAQRARQQNEVEAIQEELLDEEACHQREVEIIADLESEGFPPFHRSSCGGGWSRVLSIRRTSCGWEFIEMDLVPANTWSADEWNDLRDGSFRMHSTSRGENDIEAYSLPDEQHHLMEQHLGAKTMWWLLGTDFLPLIDVGKLANWRRGEAMTDHPRLIDIRRDEPAQ